MKKFYQLLVLLLFPIFASTAMAEIVIDDNEFDDDVIIEIADPLEPINRVVFAFNDKVYLYALKPIAKVFRYIPEPARVSLKNFISNITTPIRMINALLQGKFQDAGTEGGRFLINTTIGILGFFDPAKDHMELYKKDEDTGQTLAVYGAGHGFYLVLPFIGPSSLRDGIGLVGDFYMDPIPRMLEDQDYYLTLLGVAVNDISLDKDTYESIKKERLDPYLFVRDAYAQNRQGKVEE